MVSSHTTDSKSIKQEVNSTVILPLLVFLGQVFTFGYVPACVPCPSFTTTKLELKVENKTTLRFSRVTFFARRLFHSVLEKWKLELYVAFVALQL